MKVKLCESNWLHYISGDVANKFRLAIDAEDLEGAVKTSIALLNDCKKFFDPEGQEDEFIELEDLIKDFEVVEIEYDAIDNLLDDLYDFCDDQHIWIPLIDEEEDEEAEEQPAEEPAEEPEAIPEDELEVEENK